MTTPPNYREVECCANCTWKYEYYAGGSYCIKYEYSEGYMPTNVCDDWQKEGE